MVAQAAQARGLSYKIAQSRYNLRLLYYIKKELGVGSVTKYNKT